MFFPLQMNDAHGLNTAVTSLRHHDQLHVQQNSCLLPQFQTMLYRNKKVWHPNYTYPSQVSAIIHKNLHYSNKTICKNKHLHETTISGSTVKSLLCLTAATADFPTVPTRSLSKKI